jgi:hypothetical protein
MTSQKKFIIRHWKLMLKRKHIRTLIFVFENMGIESGTYDFDAVTGVCEFVSNN